jgi:hypothetical protein
VLKKSAIQRGASTAPHGRCHEKFIRNRSF